MAVVHFGLPCLNYSHQHIQNLYSYYFETADKIHNRSNIVYNLSVKSYLKMINYCFKLYTASTVMASNGLLACLAGVPPRTKLTEAGCVIYHLNNILASLQHTLGCEKHIRCYFLSISCVL